MPPAWPRTKRKARLDRGAIAVKLLSMTKDSPNLDGAYALDTPDATRKLYADWADTYDTGFAVDMDFLLPAHVAELCQAHGAQGPFLDVGAGTGLVGALLAADGQMEIDALDLSPEMLAVAGRKGVYRALIEADVTQPLEVGGYQTIVSSGTFTHGHVGPDALAVLLDAARPGALFVLSINAEHYSSHGFEEALNTLPITDLHTEDRAIYGPNAKGDHAKDLARFAIFRKA